METGYTGDGLMSFGVEEPEQPQKIVRVLSMDGKKTVEIDWVGGEFPDASTGQMRAYGPSIKIKGTEGSVRLSGVEMKVLAKVLKSDEEFRSNLDQWAQEEFKILQGILDE